jgi:phosphoglycolate phosphatase
VGRATYYNIGAMSGADFSMVRAFVFDLDGTLIDSKLDLVISVNEMLRQMDRKALSTETVASYIGHGAPRLIASALGPQASEEERKTGLSLFLGHYAKHNLDLTRPYPGVQEALEALAGRPMAVLTNKPAKMSVEILKGLGLARHFTVVYGGDSFEKKKPDPEGALAILRELGALPGETAMVGDSDVDMQTARNAGTLAVGVTYGFGQHDRDAYPADVYVDRLTELLAITIKPSRA